MSPPTNADALNYHWGIPMYILRHNEWAPTSIWLHGSLAGIGEIYNTFGVISHAENLGTILQSVSLIAFALYLTKSTGYDKTVFIEEALHRLVEVYYKIGLVDEAKKAAVILGYNYQSSEWYERSYKVFNKKYKARKIKKQKKKGLVRRKIEGLFK